MRPRGSPISCRYMGRNENFVLVAGHQAAILRPTARRSASRSSQMRWYRRRILEIHTREYAVPDEDIELLVDRSKLFTGAEIEQSIKNSLYLLPSVRDEK